MLLKKLSLISLLIVVIASSASVGVARSESAQATTYPVSKVISREALTKYKHVDVSVKENDKDVTYSGVPLRELLAEMVPETKLDVMPGWKELARKELVFEAKGTDGYPGLVTALEVAMNKDGTSYVLATERESKPLEFNVQLICSHDQAHTRWVKDVVSLRVVSVSEK
ncbi:MAG TPA: hypothetical protein V6C81_17410 [Planktothrix sp.]|jgi:hypothetical protein